MKRAFLAATLIGAIATVASAASRDPIGRETTISDASGGGLTNWQPGPAGSNSAYVQDRTLRWYLVTLTGPCLEGNQNWAMLYTTDAIGEFDRFSEVWSNSFPQAHCRVTSIKTSLPPKGQPGAPRSTH